MAKYRPYSNLRTLWDSHWTINNDEFQAMVQRAIFDAGSLKALSEAIDMKSRAIRRIRDGDTYAVSYRVADQILARSSVAYRLQDLPWFTAEELVDLGVWHQQLPHVRRKRQPRRAA